MSGLSLLQKYVLTSCLSARGAKLPREEFLGFYRGKRSAPTKRDQQNSVTKSLERLVDRGFLTVKGTKTPKKLYIAEARLTPAGRKRARSLLGRQQTLPLRSR